MSETETKTKTISNLRDFAALMGVDDPRRMPRALYKGTACGASLGLTLENNGRIYEGSKGWEALTFDSPVVGVTVGSIVEGSDVEVCPRYLDFPFTAAQWGEAVEGVEDEADFYWRRDNLDHFCVTRPGVMFPPVVEAVDVGGGTVLWHGSGAPQDTLTPAERQAATQAVLAWEAEDAGPQPDQKRKVGDLTVECYSQADFFFD